MHSSDIMVIEPKYHNDAYHHELWTHIDGIRTQYLKNVLHLEELFSSKVRTRTVAQDAGCSLGIMSLCHLYEFITHGDKHHSDILVL